jgi:PAT family beta-lactamase induction signal transducer AmpG
MTEAAVKTKPSYRNPWAWIPSLYFAEGIPYVVVMTVSVIFYKRMGISNTDIALYTSWLYLPWVLKPLWSPIVEILKTKRFWIIIMQLLIGAGLGGVALTSPMPAFFNYTLAFFWLLAFSSATHDIAADGFYMLGLSQHDQVWFVGIRSTFYRIAMITAQGLLIILAGHYESTSGLPAVEIQVSASPTVAAVAPTHPDSLVIVPQAGDLRIIVPQSANTMSVVTLEKKQTDSLVGFAKKWNQNHGFTAAEKVAAAKKDIGWWEEYISAPAGNFLRRNFAPADSKPKQLTSSGNTGYVYCYLSSRPPEGKEIIVTFARERGDEISLVEGSRFAFNASNWNKPAIAVVQIDSKFRGETASYFKYRAGDLPYAWMLTFYIVAGLFILLFAYHKFILPYPTSDKTLDTRGLGGLFKEFFATFSVFFKKKNIVIIILFLILYRFAEAQLVKMVSPFLLDPREVGGLGLTTGQIGFAYGTMGIVALTIGGLLGGFFAAKKGLKATLWWFVCILHFPDLVFVVLAYLQPENFWAITAGVALEQFGYGFGFTAYMLYMLYVAEGEFKTAHYAICTGFMALGMMVPGMFSGWLQDIVGYQHFFVWVMISTIPGFLVAAFIKVDPTFGKKVEEAKA